MAYFDGAITLTSKGSSTGAAVVTGLPFTVAANANCIVYVTFYTGMSSITSWNAFISSPSSNINLDITAATSIATSADTNFGNSTAMTFSGFCHTT